MPVSWSNTPAGRFVRRLPTRRLRAHTRHAQIGTSFQAVTHIAQAEAKPSPSDELQMHIKGAQKCSTKVRGGGWKKFTIR